MRTHYWVTSALDGVDHIVSEQAQATAIVAGHGVFEALCGASFLAASMCAPPAHSCQECHRFLEVRTTVGTFEGRLADPPGWLSHAAAVSKKGIKRVLSGPALGHP